MEDSVYFTNILRLRECAVCGTDRKASAALAVTSCAVCHGTLDTTRAYLAVARGGARAACSRECAEASIQEGLVGGDFCPACGSPWAAAAPHARTCRTCAKDLSWDAGYLGLWDAGRLHAFCSPACLTMHEERANPFCG